MRDSGLSREKANMSVWSIRLGTFRLVLALLGRLLVELDVARDRTKSVLGSTMTLETPLDRAIAKRDEIELELRKCPDFQLYLITKSRRQRARMEQLLMEIPNFKLWRRLATSVARAQRRLALSLKSAANRVHAADLRTLPVTWSPATKAIVPEGGSQ